MTGRWARWCLHTFKYSFGVGENVLWRSFLGSLVICHSVVSTVMEKNLLLTEEALHFFFIFKRARCIIGTCNFCRKLKLSPNRLTDTPVFLRVLPCGPGRVLPCPQPLAVLICPKYQALFSWAGREFSVDQYMRGSDTQGLYVLLVIFQNSLMKSISAYNPQVCTQVFSSAYKIKHRDEL